MNLDGTSSRPTLETHIQEYTRSRLWYKLTQAIEAKDMEAATRAKTAVEDAQRDLRRRRDESGEVFVPRYFELRDGRWYPKLKCVRPCPPWRSAIDVRFLCVCPSTAFHKIPQKQQYKP